MSPADPGGHGVQVAAAGGDSPAAVPLVTSPLTGRDEQLAALTTALTAPRAVVLVEGELGIGKSRLVAEYLASDAGRAVRPVVASCPPFGQPQTLGPVAEALRLPAASVAGLKLSGLGGALHPLFPEWSQVLPAPPESAADPTMAKGRLFRALAELLGRLRAGLLVVEDVHWADEATLEFLLFLASRPPGGEAPPALLVTARPEEMPPASLVPRLARLTAGTRGLRLALGPLTQAGTAELISSMLGAGGVSDQLARVVHEQTGGVPLAVEELVRLLAERSDLVVRDGRWTRRRTSDLAVPPTIRDLMLERSARLTPDARQVLAAAAVLGEPAGENLIEAVAGLDADRVRSGLTDGLGSALLAEDDRGAVAFRHALYSQAVYEAIPGPQRRQLHHRAGEALERSGAAAVKLARHFGQAGDTSRWQEYCRQAADQASAVGDQAACATLLTAVVTSSGLEPAKIAQLMARITMPALPGPSLRELEVVLRRVLDAGGLAPEAAALRFQLGRVLSAMNQEGASRAELERAADGLPPGSAEAAQAMVLLGWADRTELPASEHLRWLRRAAIPADAPPLERLRLSIDRAIGLLQLGEEAGWEQAAEIPREPRTPSENLEVIRAHRNFGELAITWGRYADARRRLEHALALAEQYGYESTQPQEFGAADLARLDFLTGAWDGLAGRAGALAADENVRAAPRLDASLVCGLLAAARGDRDRSLPLLAEYVSAVRQRGNVQDLIAPSAALARLHLAVGEVSEALVVTAEPAALIARKDTWIWGVDLVSARVAALAAAGQVDEAAALTENFAGGIDGRAAPAAQAGLVECRATVAESRGDLAEAADLYGEAAAAWEQLPRPYDALLASQRQAGCLLRDGQREPGLELLTEAAEGLRQLGALGDAERAEAMLAESGARPQSRPGPGRPGYGSQLSPREQQVVRLVAAGHTSREIARELKLSTRTVEGHVRSAMGKLNASSRTELAVIAAGAHLI